MQPQRDAYATLYALAQKLVGHRIYLQGEAPDFIVGKMPDNVPFPVPLPDECDLLGSMTSTQERNSGLANITIVLETPMSPEAVFDFYFTHFTQEGWKMNTPQKRAAGFAEHGFVHDFAGVSRTFYREVGQLTFSVQAVTLPFSVTEVQLTINEALDPMISRHLENQTRGYEMIPVLVAPLGAKQTANGGSGFGGGAWQTAATLESERSTSMLAMHYGVQLEEAGWTRNNVFESDDFSWHTWMIKDKNGDEWRGLFYVLKKPDTVRTRLLHVEVELQR